VQTVGGEQDPVATQSPRPNARFIRQFPPPRATNPSRSRSTESGPSSRYALLARAAGEVTERDSERIAALEDQLAFITRRRVWHHHHEDEHVFPRLRAVDQDLADLLGDLEQDHVQLDRLLAITGEVTTAFGRRAPAIRDLHRRLAAHLEREEAQAVPAIRRIIPASAWALEDVRFQDGLGTDRTTTLIWLLGHLAAPARDGREPKRHGVAAVLSLGVAAPQDDGCHRETHQGV
jgi:hypothetical protein